MLLYMALSMPLLFPAPLREESPAPKKYVGRLGELTREEQARIDKIIERFILFDIGVHRDPLALHDFMRLGPEAIPGLTKGLNRSALMSDSCPVHTIAKKLSRLIAQVEDESVLRYLRSEIGAGVELSPYRGLLQQLRLQVSQRQAQLARERLAAQKAAASRLTRSQPPAPAGSPEP